MLTKDLVEKPARCLQLPRALLLFRMRLKHESRHSRNLAKTSQGEFGRIEARKNVVIEFVRWKQASLELRGPIESLRAQQFETVVAHRNRKRAGPVAGDSPREQSARSDMRGAPRERIAVEVVTLARFEQLDDEYARLGQRRPLLLQFEQRPHRRRT
ncbi:hypothetical protein HDG38_003170 [Paraburkholderia sp. WSM4177]|nr:hypothetical protein [Paraburkholderia sp. WSM4177]MBB5485365.1 hypothetical protein [Paraburkholderia sp. WSM4180]